ncbi:MAG: leucine-rich repeat domain-containing protein, partial [Oscillospiraceae bacterium]|nr:leucine-rich repeat domain-containing protein [Oscillospiraceae bacterium]
MSEKATTGRHVAEKKASTGRHAAVAAPVSKKRILSKKVCIYLSLCMAAVFMLMISAVMIMNSVEKESYEQRMSSALESFQRKDYEDALHYLRAAAEIDASEDCLMMIADCYDRLGNYDKALETLRSMDVSKSSVSRKIAAIEQKRALLSTVEKAVVAGREYPINSNSLALDGLGINNDNLVEIQAFYALENLSLADNEISDISALTCLGGISTLNLSGNNISDLSSIASLTSLRTLYLDYNPISDLRPLYSLSNLANLSIKGMEITENELAELSAALPGCAVHSETAVEDVLDISMGGITIKSDVTELDLSQQNISDISA